MEATIDVKTVCTEQLDVDKAAGPSLQEVVKLPSIVQILRNVLQIILEAL